MSDLLSKIFALFIWGIFLHTACAETTPGPRSVSVSKQFFVYGADENIRSVFCVFAEQIKKDYFSLFSRREREGLRIVINIKGAVDDVSAKHYVKAQVESIADDYRFQLNVGLSRNFRRSEFQEKLTYLLIAESILQGRKIRPQKDPIPSWLYIGISEALNFRRQGRPKNLYTAFLNSGKVMSVKKILSTEPEGLDLISDSVYRASVGGFVLALMGRPNGREKLYRLMRDLVKGKDVKELLEVHFSELDFSENKIEKWWALQIATLAQPTVYEILTLQESEKMLSEALRIMVFEKEQGKNTQYELQQYRSFLDKENIGIQINLAESEMLKLSHRVHPFYRPLVREYQAILAQLEKKKRRGLDRRLRKLTEQRENLQKQAYAIEDYMNWYAATQQERSSGEFIDYQKIEEQLREKTQTERGPISQYLDSLE